jgi:hypothetical protein
VAWLSNVPIPYAGCISVNLFESDVTSYKIKDLNFVVQLNNSHRLANQLILYKNTIYKKPEIRCFEQISLLAYFGYRF